MKLSVLEQITYKQKETLMQSDTGLPRNALGTLPSLETHALIISGIRRCGKSTPARANL